MKHLILIPIIALAACTSTQEKRDYRRAQVDVISTQVEARSRDNSAGASARASLYKAMAEVAKNAPDSADAIAVAMAISSVREESDTAGPVIQLHRESNEALEVVKAIAPALVNTIGTVAVAGYQASVNKTQSNNAASVAIADSAANADVMRSVTAMATTGLGRDTVSVGGNYTTVGGDLDQSTTASTETTTSTSTATEVVTDSNNTTTYTTTEGDSVTLEDIQALLEDSLQVTVLIDDEEVVVEQCSSGSGFTFGGGSSAC